MRIGKLLRREGEDPRVSEIFYQAVMQAVLLFGAENWVLLVAMYRNLELVHMVFLRQMIGHKAKRKRDETWISEGAAQALTEEGTETLGAYIENRQSTVSEWVALRPIMEICDRETV